MNDPLAAQQRVRRQVLRRRRWRRLRLAVLVLLASTAVVAAAVGIDRLAVVVHKFYDEHHHSQPRAAGVSHQTTSTTSTTVAGPARCGGPQLSAVVSDWRDTGGTVQEIVSLTNISATTCSVAGYPTVGVAGQDGTPLPTTNSDVAAIGAPGTVGATSPVGSTVPATPIPLVHGARASFELSYANICDHVLAPGQAATGVPNECYSGIWLEVTPIAGSAPLIVTEPLHLTFATSGFQVAPLQAGDGSPLAGQPPLTAQTTSPAGPPTTAPANP